MADDGLLLNFQAPVDVLAPKQRFKGGNWRDRLKAGRAVRTTTSIPRFRDVRSEDEELILPQSHPSKRLKTGEGAILKEASNPNLQHPDRVAGRTQNALPKSINKEVISSLFTYNPQSKVSQAKVEQQTEEDVEPSNAPLADELATFTNLGLSSTLANHLLNKLDIKAPTAIQRKAVEQLCSTDTDAFIQAETGSGKTLAYLLPLMQRLADLSQNMNDAGQDFTRESGLFAIVLAPTRELAKQIESVLESLLSCYHWIVGGIVIGGEKKKSEKARLRKGLNILVATPGRLVDHLDNTEVLNVSKVRWLVLDEGDRLMELGFEQDIQKIISVLNLRGRKMPETPIRGLLDRRTTVLCSATMKPEIEQLRSVALKNPVSISVDPAEKSTAEDDKIERKFSAPAQLKQSYAVVPAKQRLVTLVAVLKQTFKRKGSCMKCIVFFSCADSVDFHFELLTRVNGCDSVIGSENERLETGEISTLEPTPLSRSNKVPQGGTIPDAQTHGPAAAFSTKENEVQLFRLHGSLQQAVRTSTLKAFIKSSEPSVLICTDVASRGLDLPNIDLVIEYDPPFNPDDHLHRIGRTARAGREGRTMIFLMPGCEEGYIEILKDGRPHHLTSRDADDLLKKGFAARTGVALGSDWEAKATDWQLDAERWVLEHSKHLEQARRAFQSHIRAYATHISGERRIFDMQQLHLGHLAKAFALRDKPGSIRVPGLRPDKNVAKKPRNVGRAQASIGGATSSKHHQSDDNLHDTAETDARDARRKMQARTKALGGASEFNLG